MLVSVNHNKPVILCHVVYTMYTGMNSIEDARCLLGSVNRVRLLTELDSQPSRPTELAESIDVSRSAVQRTLSEFAERGWVRKRNGVYESTTAGSVLLGSSAEFLDAVGTVNLASGFLSLLPEIGTVFTVDTLEDATIVESTPRNPHAPLQHYASRLDTCSTDSFRGISPVVSPVLDDAHTFLLEGENESELIIDGGVLGVSQQSILRG
jgi:predicted transcriptional regulator